MTRTALCSMLMMFAGTSAACASDVTFRTVVLTGDPVPGAPVGTVFDSIFQLTMNQAGQTAGFGSVISSSNRVCIIDR